VCSGDEAFEILKSKAFISGHLPRLSPLVAGQSVLSQDGDAHRHLRSALNGPFLPRGLSASTVGAMSAAALAGQVGRWIERGRARVLRYHLAWLTAVQFSTILARELGRAGVRPRLRGPMPVPVYVPTEHPPEKTIVDLVPAGA
jgi:hypothetical protein